MSSNGSHIPRDLGIGFGWVGCVAVDRKWLDLGCWDSVSDSQLVLTMLILCGVYPLPTAIQLD